ncbi:hypothetical protein HPP92_006179 [Vanilla planifolia]|uniref:Uncharacterized protein n=1 Tax=Vanilla planifolia TaxID=51239 RepID=A0A835RQ39_VANPL|nr:hypothetical protein HPP92_006179 [Vanilla planifolia]
MKCVNAALMMQPLQLEKTATEAKLTTATVLFEGNRQRWSKQIAMASRMRKKGEEETDDSAVAACSTKTTTRPDKSGRERSYGCRRGLVFCWFFIGFG